MLHFDKTCSTPTHTHTYHKIFVIKIRLPPRKTLIARPPKFLSHKEADIVFLNCHFTHMSCINCGTFMWARMLCWSAKILWWALNTSSESLSPAKRFYFCWYLFEIVAEDQQLRDRDKSTPLLNSYLFYRSWNDERQSRLQRNLNSEHKDGGTAAKNLSRGANDCPCHRNTFKWQRC